MAKPARKRATYEDGSSTPTAAQTLEVLRLDPDGRSKILAVHAGDARLRAEPFEAIELKLSRLWG